MQMPIHLVMNRAVRPALDDETALLRARGRELSRRRRRSARRLWLASVVRSASVARSGAGTMVATRPGSVPARPA